MVYSIYKNFILTIILGDTMKPTIPVKISYPYWLDPHPSHTSISCKFFVLVGIRGNLVILGM